MSLTKEKNYEFRKRMRILHQAALRDNTLLAEADDLILENGLYVVLPENSGEVILCAAKDFQDFLFTSMGLSSMLVREQGQGLNLVLVLDATLEADYHIAVSDCVMVRGKTERALAQALYCLEDKMRERRAPYLKKEETRHTFLFSPRMVHSGYRLDEYPDEHLSAIAHAGMDSILVFVKDINLTPTGFLDFNELIRRAAKYGLDVYAYSYLNSEMHPEDPGAQDFYDNLYGKLFEQCPGFRGVILVGESVGFPSHDPNVTPKNQKEAEDGIPYGKPSPGWWPCVDYPEWLACVKKAVRKHKEDADIVFWTYNWGYVDKEKRLELIRSLPTDISLMATFEMFETYPRDNFKQTVADYSLAFAGPGYYFSTEAEVAKERGIRLYTMANTGGLTWDMGTIPYEPMPYQWMNRYKGLREAHDKYGLCGLMDSHHFGFWPSFIGDLAKQCFIQENSEAEDNLTRVIKMRFGKANVGVMKEALRLFSEAIRCYTPSDADQYGAFRIGPSYPLCLVKDVKPPSVPHAHFGTSIVEVSYPADYSPSTLLPCGRGMLPSLRIAGEIESLEKMLSCMKEGLALLGTIQDPNEELLYLKNLGAYICCCVQTGIHAKEWFLTVSALRIEQDREQVRVLIEKARELLLKERANAESALPLVELDSRLGWEPSMEYVADSEHIKWKLKHLDYVLDTELQFFVNASADKWYE